MTWQPLEPSVPHQYGKPIKLSDDEDQWANNTYVVIRRRMDGNDGATAYHLSIRRQDREPVRDWRDFQRIKNQLAGPEYEAVEIYPAESRLVDMANQFHLWCFPFQLPFGFGKRLVGNQFQAEIVTPGAVQRDPEVVDLQYGGLSKIAEMKADNPPYREDAP